MCVRLKTINPEKPIRKRNHKSSDRAIKSSRIKAELQAKLKRLTTLFWAMPD